MIRTGTFGGLIGVANILNPNKTITALRYASSGVREAAKIGLQSLFAHPEQILEKYSDFDIVKEMKDRQNSKLLWVRARAIDANKVNSNGDWFSEEEILKETEYKGEKVPAYKTFEGVPIYSNHKNDDIELAKGMVVYAEWDDSEKCVYCTFFIDEEAYPDIARGVRQGYIHDVSMGTSVQEGECSHCGNIATIEREWCDHLKKYKGKKHPESGKIVYEINRGLKFIELSCVGDGAFDLCEIHELYEPEEVIQFAEGLNKKASELQASIHLAASFSPNNLQDKYAYEDCLRKASNATQSLMKVAQQAGNFVAGDIMELPQSSQNATVTNILQFLGIDPKSGLNILDLLNLALNFLEVSVMNLFAKKDNIDLTHVSKISKAMAELQTTMQDLIDEGGVGGQQPPAAPPQPGNQNVQPVQPVQGAGGIGSITAPPPTPSVVPPTNGVAAPQSSFGGGIADQSQALAKTLESLKNLKLALSQEEGKRLANNNNIGGKIMSFMSEFKHNFNESQMAYEAVAPTGEKIVISSNGNVSAYRGDKKSPFAAGLLEDESNLILSGDLKSAANSVLKRFMKFSNEIPFDSEYNEDLNQDNEEKSPLQKVNDMKPKAASEPVNKQLEPHRIYDSQEEPNKTLNERTRPLRKNNFSTPTELGLEKEGWSSRKGVKDELKEKLLEVARRGVDDRVMEERLEKWKETDGKAAKRIEKIIGALAKVAIKHGMHPNEVMVTAAELAELGPEPIGLSKELNDSGVSVPDIEDTPEKAVTDGLSEEINETTTPGDIHAVLETLSENLEDAAKALQAAVDTIKADEAVNPKIEDSEPSDSEQVSAELATKADSAPTDAGTQDVQAGVSAMANTMDQLNVGPDDVMGSVGKMSTASAHKLIELEKLESAQNARIRNSKRIQYYGFNRKASKKEIAKTLFGNLAQYSLDYGLRPKNLAQTLVAMTSAPQTTSELVKRALYEKKNIRTAKTEITDSQSNEKTIRLTADDLGIELSSPEFVDKLKEKVVELLSKSGYHIDPNNFSMNEVNVSPSGDIDVRVFTRFNRTYNPEDGQVSMTDHNLEDNDLGDHDLPMSPEVSGLIESRTAKRNRLINKYAQALPPMPAGPGLGAVGAMPPAPAPAADFVPPLGSENQAGAVALSDDAVGAEGEENPESSSAPSGDSVMPGVKKPWGTVCPQCQSINVEISNGEGKCNDCGAQLRYEFMVHVSPPSKGEEYKGTFDYKELGQSEGALGGSETELGAPPAEVGLGAATATETPGLGEAPAAPAPATPPAGAMPPAAPAMAKNSKGMVRVSYITDPDVFVNANSTVKKEFEPLPVGLTCPSCASRNVNKKSRYTFCSDCKTLSVSSVQEMISNPEQVISSISWMI